MLSALWYLQRHTVINRTRARLNRLRQPKYLIGAIVGAAYFYFYFFRFAFQGVRNGPRFAPEDLLLYECLGAAALFVILFMAWFIPRERGALAFTEAEVAFLFPAPISRRGLIHFKLFRSQAAILVSVLLLTLLTNRAAGRAWIQALGLWVIMSTLNLHFLGSSLSRTMLLDRGITTAKRRLLVAGLAVAALAATAVWAWLKLPAFDADLAADPAAIKAYLNRALTTGPAAWLLFPLRLVVRPYLAPDALHFLASIWPALLLLALHYAWVVRLNVSFEEASVEASRKLAEKIAAMRSGNWQGTAKPVKARKQPFALRPAGHPAVALLWKNLISAGHGFSPRVWVSLAVLGVVLAMVVSQTTRTSGLGIAAATAMAILLAWSVLLGPQFLRQDLRQDLAAADVLKTYPLPGWQIVLGEMLAPAVILSGIQYLLVLVAVLLLAGQRGPAPIPVPDVIGFALAAMMVFPFLNLIALLFPNAAVLLFPGWFQSSRESPHGMEAMGQRIIFVAGQFLAFLLILVLPAAAFALVFFGGKFLLNLSPGLCAVPAAAAAAAVMAAETAGSLVLLGRRFERFDLSSD